MKQLKKCKFIWNKLFFTFRGRILGTFLILSICPLILIFFFSIQSSGKALSISGNQINKMLLDYVTFLHKENLTKQSEIINEQFDSLKKEIHILQTAAEDIFSWPIPQNHYKLSLKEENEGYYWEEINGDVSNAGMSANLEPTLEIQSNLIKSKLLENGFKQIYHQETSITRVFYLGTKSYWRVFPKINVPEHVETGQFLPNTDFTTWPIYSATANSSRNEEIWTSPLLDLATTKMFSLSVPIYDNNGVFKGIIGLDISTEKFLKHFLNFHFKEPSAYAILISSDNHIIAKQKKAQKDLPYLTSSVIQKIYNRKQPFVLNLNSSEKIILVSTISETNWKIVYIVPKNEIINPVKTSIDKQLNNYIQTFSIQSIFLLVTIIFAMTALSFMIWKHHTKPFQEILHGIHSISSKNFQVKINDQRLEEFQFFVQSFNEMAKKINDLITKYQLLNVHLEEKVSNRTILLRKSNEMLQLTNEKLVTMEQTRKEMFANIAHDLKTPITLILGYIEAINDKMIKTSQHEEYLHRIHKHLLSINNLVKGIYELNNVEMGEQVFHFQKANLKDILLHITDLFDQDINFHLYMEEKIPYINMDQKYMERAIFNLIENSIKYSNNYTQVDINVKSQISHVVISIKDYGWVIPHEDLPYIFDRFYRVDRARNSAKAGNGLGLSIVKEIIGAHRGSIKVQSELEKGTEFVIILPIN